MCCPVHPDQSRNSQKKNTIFHKFGSNILLTKESLKGANHRFYFINFILFFQFLYVATLDIIRKWHHQESKQKIKNPAIFWQNLLQHIVQIWQFQRKHSSKSGNLGTCIITLRPIASCFITT